MKRSAADILTLTRLYSIIPLTALAAMQWRVAFVTVYAVAILTDVFDGLVARKTGVASQQGADLDGTVDLVFCSFGALWLWMFTPWFFTIFWPFIIAVAASFALFFIVSYWKRGYACMPHLWSGKLAMALVSILIPVTVLFNIVHWLVHVTWIVVVFSRLEMVLFLLRGATNMDARWAFGKQ